jgi:hypothetical protein
MWDWEYLSSPFWTEQYNNVGLGILVFPFLDGTVHFSSAATVTAARLWGLIDNQWLTFFFLPLGSYFGILGFFKKNLRIIIIPLKSTK